MFKSVLIPVDITLPEETRKILGRAKLLAGPWNSKIHVVTVVPDVGMAIVGSYFDEEFEAATLSKARDELKAAVATAGIEAEIHAYCGTVYDRVIAAAKKLDVDLIVIGAHRPELQDYLLGSNASRLVRHSKKSVLVLRD